VIKSRPVFNGKTGNDISGKKGRRFIDLALFANIDFCKSTSTQIFKFLTVKFLTPLKY